MDDVIVIILTLIFIVASFFGQKKKKPPVPQTEQKAENENFWEMLNEEWKEAQQPVVSPQQKPVEQQEQTDADSQPYTFDAENEGAEMVSIKPKKEKTTIQKVKKKKFPLRDAVIYSEILNRKYT
jgi:hypothetical protein